ncbi:histidine permease [Tilletia horrida]|nr:histidine permease [Tilletia horrida]
MSASAPTSSSNAFSPFPTPSSAAIKAEEAFPLHAGTADESSATLNLSRKPVSPATEEEVGELVPLQTLQDASPAAAGDSPGDGSSAAAAGGGEEGGGGPSPTSALTDSMTLPGDDGLLRKLQSRHMQMIAIGGNIGTGLFMGSGNALYSGGPAAVLLGYIYIACMLYFVTVALAEMATAFPVSGSFVTFASRFIEPAWGFALGWSYFSQWLIALPIQLTVVTMLIAKWDNGSISPGVWIALFLVAIAAMNLLGIEKYGHAEMVLSMTKIIAIILFIIIAFAIDMGAGPDNHFRGGKTWSDPGAFKNGFKGVCEVLIAGAFSFAGTEIIGLTAAESENPRKEVPKATKQVFWTITFCNVVSVFFIGLIVPSTDVRLGGGSSSSGASSSPFVLALETGKLKGLPHLFNAVILLSVFSVGISSVYAASRTLVALAEFGQAPRVCGRIDARGRPLVAIAISLASGCLGFLQYASDAEDIFRWLLALSGLATIFTWLTIGVGHLRFRRAWERQGHKLEELPFRARTGTAGSMLAIGMNVLILVFHFYTAAWPIGQDAIDGEQRAKSFFQAYLAAPFVLLFYATGKLLFRESTLVKLEDIDLQTGRRHVPLEDLETDRHKREAASSRWKKLWRVSP